MKHNHKLIVLLVVLLLFLTFPLASVSAETVDKKIEDDGYQEEEIMEIHHVLEKIMKKNDGFFYNDLGRTGGSIFIK